MVEALLAGALAAFGGIDIHGAHTSHTTGGCTGDYARSCTWVVREWAPDAEGRGGKLPFERSGRITRIKLPVSGETTVTVRVVRKAGKDAFRVRASSPPLRATRKGWIKAALNLSYRKGDAIAFGVRGDEGPFTVHGGMDDGPNGEGDLKLAKGNSATTIRNAFDPPADGDDSLSSQGISMVLALSG
jgi:hypothetical protein